MECRGITIRWSSAPPILRLSICFYTIFYSARVFPTKLPTKPVSAAHGSRSTAERSHFRQALTLLAFAIEADATAANGRDAALVWGRIRCGSLDRDYVRFLGEQILRLTRKPPNKARYALRKFAEQLQRGRGRYSWYGRHTTFAEQFTVSVRVWAEEIPQGKRGNPKFQRGKTSSAAQKRVNDAFEFLDALARSTGYANWDIERNAAGRAGKPSRGRDLIRRHALSKAQETDELCDAMENIRERIKSERRPQRRRRRAAARQKRDE